MPQMRALSDAAPHNRRLMIADLNQLTVGFSTRAKPPFARGGG
jgi:hypothetical protein